MLSCGSPFNLEVSEISSYSLKTLASATAPQNFNGLQQWLARSGKYETWDGKMYVASTIHWDSRARQFLQTGCSPNYQGGWWSLACCKHDMRTARPFREKAIDLSIPSYVFTLGSLNPEVGQPLVSVAQVTEYCFETMENYAKFLREQQDEALISSRSTRARLDDGLLGWRFGDCHADLSGEVGEPYPGHVHYRDKSWKRDTDGKHMILVSNRFLLWGEPAFVATKMQKQTRYGKDIDSQTLHELLNLAPTR
jgi:hypothetical protein